MDCQVDLHMGCGHDSLLTFDAVIQRFIPIFLFTQCVHRMIVLTTTLAQGKMSCAFVFLSQCFNCGTEYMHGITLGVHYVGALLDRIGYMHVMCVGRSFECRHFVQ